jgi:ribosomal protein S18 acetylase RimI-like enzyme
MTSDLRLGIPADIDGAAGVWARATAKRDGKIEIPSLEAARAVLLDCLQKERSTFVVAADESAVIGFAAAEPTASAHVAEVRFVGVDPDCWGSGVGGAVIARLADELASAGFLSAQLLVYADNAPARRLYERMGWTWDEQNPSLHPRTGKPEIRYRLGLDAGRAPES